MVYFVVSFFFQRPHPPNLKKLFDWIRMREFFSFNSEYKSGGVLNFLILHVAFEQQKS